MNDLEEFLLVRIQDEEEVARAASTGAWKIWGMQVITDPKGTSRLEDCLLVANTAHETGLRTWNAMHIIRHQPANVLTECESKRAIVELHKPYRRIVGVGCEVCPQPRHLAADAPGWPCETLRLLAVSYSSHPDFREESLPTGWSVGIYQPRGES